jgi:hypothetical protein
MMCDERVSNLCKIEQSLATRVPEIIPQRDEEIIPSLKETLVSVVLMCAEINVFDQLIHRIYDKNIYFLFCIFLNL